MHTRLRLSLPVVIGLAAILPALVAVAQTAETPQEYVQRLIKEANKSIAVIADIARDRA